MTEHSERPTDRPSTDRSRHPRAPRSAAGISRAIVNGELSSAEAVEECLGRIGRLDPKLRAMAYVNADAARKRAAEADAALRRGENWGPLHGVPVTVKDQYATRGIPTTVGLPSLKNQVPDHDATAVKRLLEAGAVLLGKTNMPPLAMDFQTRSPLFGTANNPWDLSRTPGGSTGGGAAAVAAGLSPLELGTDLMGSIRIPAGFCGVFAFRPTEGTVPLSGANPGIAYASPRTARHLLCPGFISREIDDLELALSVTAGPDAGEPEIPRLARNFVAGTGARLSVAWTDGMGETVCSENVREVLAGFINRLAAAGITVRKEFPDEFDPDEALEIFGELFSTEYLRFPLPLKLLISLSRSREDRAFPANRTVLRTGYLRYLGILERRERLVWALERFLQHADCLACPVTMTEAPRHIAPRGKKNGITDYGAGVPVDGKTVYYTRAFAGFTLPFSLTGHPVAVIPAGFTREVLPVGVQLIGRRWDDYRLLEIARTMFRAAGEYRFPPEIADAPERS
jgi:amidase